MRRLLIRVGVAVLAVAAVAAASGCVPDPPPVPTPIGTNERFSGLVNGERDGAVVYTVCGGPTWEGRRGPVASGQTFTVTPDALGDGDTGSHSSAVFVQPDTNWFVAQIQTYDVPVAFPTDVDVPCDGSGTVTFHQCWGIIACLDGAPDVVKVRFVNIAD
jgi:hypothetical protein